MKPYKVRDAENTLFKTGLIDDNINRSIDMIDDMIYRILNGFKKLVKFLKKMVFGLSFPIFSKQSKFF